MASLKTLHGGKYRIYGIYIHIYTIFHLILILGGLSLLVFYTVLTTSWTPSLLIIGLETGIFLNTWVFLSITPWFYRGGPSRSRDPETQKDFKSGRQRSRWTARPPMIRPFILFLLQTLVWLATFFGYILVLYWDEVIDIASSYPWEYSTSEWNMAFV